MKKYAIIIGENNEELSKQVQEALFAVGFKWFSTGTAIKQGTDAVIFLNESLSGFDCDRFMTVCLSGRGLTERVNDNELLLPSYVLAHAADLEGAKVPDPLKGKTMEEWLANEDKVRFDEMPELVQGEILSRWDGKKGDESGNLKFWYETDKTWRPVSCAPDISFGSQHRLITKKPWEIPPEGYRIVTEEERKEYPDYNCEKWWGMGLKRWATERYYGMSNTASVKAFAVPLDFTFPSASVTVVCEGKETVISRADAKTLNLIEG